MSKKMWNTTHVKGERDHFGGITITHEDGSSAYVQPGDDADDLAHTLDLCGDDEENIGTLLCDYLED